MVEALLLMAVEFRATCRAMLYVSFGVLKHNKAMEKSVLIWQSELNLSAKQRDLLCQQSLTRALKALDAVFSVKLLYLGESAADVWLSDVVGQERGFVRDVLLCLDDEPVVWARSRCAWEDTTWREILNCGTQPLGERLFDGSLALTRSPFEYTWLQSEQPLAGFTGTAFAARRSVFELNGGKLGLVECFLPSLMRYGWE